jgi:hypothetical protein
MVIKRVNPLSCAKIVGAAYAVIGIFFGAVIALFVLAGGFTSAAFAANPSERTGLGTILGVLAIVVAPFFYGAMGFVFTLIAGWLYNVFARVLGGIEIEVQ